MRPGTLARRGEAAQPLSDGQVVVTLVSPAVERDGRRLLEDIQGATRGAALERLTGGCEQLHGCRLLDAQHRLTNRSFGQTEGKGGDW